MSKLINQLHNWQTQGLISEKQLHDILAYEKSRPQTSWGLMGLMTLGVSVIVLGLIAIVASNWDHISDLVKLVSAFTILICNAGLIYHYRDHQSTLVKDGLRTFFCLFIFAVIGLVAQIYNLTGDGYQTGLLWSGLTFLLITEIKNIIPTILWTVIFFLSLLVGLSELTFWSSNAGLSFFMLTITAMTLLARVFISKTSLCKALQIVTLGSWIFALTIFNLAWITSHSQDASPVINFIPHFGLSLLVASLIWFSQGLYALERKLFISALAIANFLFTFSWSIGNFYILFVLAEVLCLISFGCSFLIRKNSRLFNLILILIGAKFLEIYVKEFTGLLETGFGLIITGLLIMFIVYLWNKKRQQIESRLQEVLQ